MAGKPEGMPRAKWLESQGLCTRCGKNPPSEGADPRTGRPFKRCDKCRSYGRTKQAEVSGDHKASLARIRYNRRREGAKCGRCGDPPALNDKGEPMAYCTGCRESNNEAQAKLPKRPSTGRPRGRPRKTDPEEQPDVSA